MNKPTIRQFALILLTGSLLSAGCRHRSYYPKDQWQIPARWTRNPLKGKPIEVKESLFVGLDDTTLQNAHGRFNSYDLWRFDRDGNIVYRKYFQTDSFWMESFFHLDDAGSHLKFVAHTIDNAGQHDTVMPTSLSVLLPNGKISETGRLGDLPVSLTSFSRGGNKKTIEYWGRADTAAKGKPLVVADYFYDGQQLQRIEQRSGHVGLLSAKYYYSDRNAMDSVIYDSVGKVVRRQLYINNSYGDPVHILDIGHDGDTTAKTTIQYEYDKIGNWIKMLEREETKNKYYQPIGGVRSDYSLSAREIVYPGDK